ncbi:hypothetical protein ABL840_05320 [Variovorax sp. NFACC27]|uniref:hypothetical protein n=1 Tax=unclassified Variovorax TaxID=663243 RepID=UPI00089CD81F|nr:hypothetical protein [Variovorax sp. YR750]MDP9604628.1 hypothetical protein [Variovorax paradoxus]SEF19580.1 hypothetical protein SAMN03159371_00195 [Variovorax sp. NFACC28]SEF69578.1 hypothetical protein SAMN03159365_00623 [Variovorax sp. NFACC29]SFB76120.1 hypothetical protein SAMN03159379_00622 [Variovorax sp. NFACC26]SFG75803.1 hypothetical protein SAMN03159447_04744 [Variovorax sp. NFACC27]
MKPPSRSGWSLSLASCLVALSFAVPPASSAAELELQGSRLVVSGMLDGTMIKEFTEQLGSGTISTVVFEDSFGGTAEAAGAFADAIRASGVQTEVRGQCMAACAYAFLAGRTHRFGYGLQVNGVLLPVAQRPTAAELAVRWRGDDAHKTLSDFMPTSAKPVEASVPPAKDNARDGARDNWQPDHGVLFTASPTLFGRVYNTYYCDGTQGRDFSKCERLADADPYKLGVLTP